VARRHRGKLDWDYVEKVIKELCDWADDTSPWQRLERIRGKSG